jgi:hypothetical protein
MLAGLAAIALMASAPLESHAAEIYRCAEGDGRVLYTDFPCPGGGRVEIHPGKADPAAADRLAQAQATLDAGAAQRRAQQAREAAQREQASQMRDAAAAAESSAPPYDTALGDGYGYGYLPAYSGWSKPRRPHRPPAPLPPPKRVVPAKVNGAPVVIVPGSMSAGRTRR